MVTLTHSQILTVLGWFENLRDDLGEPTATEEDYKVAAILGPALGYETLAEAQRLRRQEEADYQYEQAQDKKAQEEWMLYLTGLLRELCPDLRFSSEVKFLRSIPWVTTVQR